MRVEEVKPEKKDKPATKAEKEELKLRGKKSFERKEFRQKKQEKLQELIHDEMQSQIPSIISQVVS